MPDYSSAGYREFTIPAIGAGGLRLDKDPWDLHPNEWQDAKNVSFLAGGVERIPGWGISASAIPDIATANDNLPVDGYGFISENLNYRSMVVATNKRLYANVTLPTSFVGAGTWVDILGSNWTSLLVQAGAAFPNLGWELFRDTLYVAPVSNAIRTWSGSAVTVNTLGGSPPQVTDFMQYGSRAVIGRLRTGAPASQQEIRWSALSDFTSWNSANNILSERIPYPIMKIKRTGAWVLVYKTQGIERLLITQNSVAPFATDIVDDGKGLLNSHALAAYYNDDYFAGYSSIYRLRGLLISDIGVPVRKQFVSSGSSTLTTAGVFSYLDPKYDEVAFSGMDDGLVYTYSPIYGTWSRRDMGGALQFIAIGYALNARQIDSSTTNQLRSFFCSSVVNPKSIYLQGVTGDAYASGFPTTSNAKTGWLDHGEIRKKRWAAILPRFTRNTGTTMTLNIRVYNNTTDVNPATGSNVVTKTLVLDGSETLIPLNLTGRWIEVEVVNNNNSQPWRLDQLTFIFNVMEQH